VQVFIQHLEFSMYCTSRSNQGFGLYELIVTIGVISIILGFSIPSLSRLVQVHRMQGASESLRSDIQMAKITALGTGKKVRLDFLVNKTGSCYVIYQGMPSSCSCAADGTPMCREGGSLVGHASLRGSTGISLTANVKSLTIEPTQGFVTPAATMRLEGSRSAHLHHVISLTGRIRTCGNIAKTFAACSGI
jgi:Tfp pilus assembly protein FimT